MVKFESEKFLDDLKQRIQQWEAISDGHNIDDLISDCYPVYDDDFDANDYDDNCVGYETEIPLRMCAYEDLKITYRELFNLLDKLKNTVLRDNTYCIEDCYFLCRVNTDYETLNRLKPLFNENEIFPTRDNYKNNEIECAIINGFTLFGLMVLSSGDYDADYLPVASEDELFIEIKSKQKLSFDDYKTIENAYLFEINASYNIRLEEQARPELDYGDDFNDSEDQDDTKQQSKSHLLRPLLFGKGLSDVVKLYNSTIRNIDKDMAILQYSKILEYISQTVIRQKTTQKLQTKLLSAKALNPNADFIKELEITFEELSQKYSSERDATKVLLETCCDIKNICCYAPNYLSKIVNLQTTLRKAKCDKDSALNECYDLLSDAISETRNYIAHAKANYSLKGHECPEEQKDTFAEMMRIIAIESIRWFSTTSEEARITVG